MITNRASAPRVMVVTALGADVAWLPKPSRSRIVAPGETVLAELTLHPSVGTLPARYPIAVAVQSLDPVTEQATAPTAIAEIALIVDAPGQVGIELSPADATAVFGKKIAVTLSNSGAVPATVRLDVQATSSTAVQLPETDVELGVGEIRRIRGRIRVRRARLFGHRARHTYSVTAHSAGAPRHVEGSLTARAMLGPGGTKFVVLATVVAVWVALAIIFIPKLADSIKKDHRITAQSAQTTSTAPGTGGAGKSGSGSSSGSGGSAGSGGSGSGGSGGGSGAAGATKSVQLNGTVAGSAPGDVHVAIKPTSLVDEATQGATGVGVDMSEAHQLGKIPSSALITVLPSVISPNRSTVTGKDGAWAFPSVDAPGYYLLTFAKPGYQTERYVVNAASATASKPLKVTLVPGQGHLSGTVLGPSGRVGGAKITITDGTNTLTTSSNSQGRVGAWSVDGLSTPSSYLISAGKDGLGTESALVKMDAGGSSTVTLRLHAGVASLVGQVSGVDEHGARGGLGGAHVTATNGTITRTATTITATPVGYYTLPDLPTPGRYTVTISDNGYLPVTQHVTIGKGQSKARVGATLTAASATVSGKVTGDNLDQNGTPRGTADLVNAGLTLNSPKNSYKITTTSQGLFRFTGIAPGTYVVGAQYANLQSRYRTVTVRAGDTVTVPTFDLKKAAAKNTSTITGFVASATSPNGAVICSASPACTTILKFRLESSGSDQPLDIHVGSGKVSRNPSAPAAPDGPTGYTLSTANGLGPGLYRLSVSANGYLTGSVRVQVPLNSVAKAPEISLFPANTIGGTLSALGSLSGSGKYVNCVWAVPQGAGSPPTTCPTKPGGTTVTAAHPDTTACTVHGRPAADLSLLDPDSNIYRISSLCDGTYNVYVVITNPDYVNPAPTAVQTVTHGQTLNYSPHVFRKGRVVLTFYTDKAGAPQRMSAVDVGAQTGVVQCKDNDNKISAVVPLSDAKNSAAGQLTIGGLADGPAQCTAYDGADKATKLGQTSGIAISKDSDTPADIVLAPSHDPVIGTAISYYGTTAGTPVSGVGLTVKGITSYDGTAATIETSPVLTTGAQGCYAVTADGKVPAKPGACTGLSDANVAELDLRSTAVTLELKDVPTGYETPAATITGQVAGGQFPSITLTPKPSDAAVALTTTNQSIPLGAQITVDKSGAPWAGTITAQVGNDGKLVWRDSNYLPFGGVAGAWPGTYQLSATLPGYTDASATMTCTFTNACTLGSGGFELVQLGSLSGTLTAIVGTASGDPSHPLIGATVTATYCDDQATAGANDCTTTSSSKPSATVTTQADGSYSITQVDGTLGLARGWWKLEFSAGGYTGTSVNVDVGSGNTGQDATLYIKLKTLQIGVVTTVPAAGEEVTPADRSPLAYVQLVRLDTYQLISNSTLNADNLYVFTGIVPTTYEVVITGPDVPTTYAIITVGAVIGSDTTQTIDITAGAPQGGIIGSVLGKSGPSTTAAGLDGVTVDLGYTNSGTFVVATDTTDKPLTTTTVNGGTYTFTNVPAGGYYLRFRFLKGGSPSGYLSQTTTSPVQVTPGVTGEGPQVTLARVERALSVTINPASVADTLTGATVGLSADPSGSNPVESDQQLTKSATGDSWTASFPNPIPYGKWTLSITLPDGHQGNLSVSSGTNDAPSLAFSNGKWTGPLTVSADPTGCTETNGCSGLSARYDLDESALSLTLTANATVTDPGPPATTDTVPPMEVTVNDGTTNYYDNTDFPLGTTSPVTLWLPTTPSSGKYTTSVAPPSDASTAWPPPPDTTVTSLSKTKTTLKALTITEQPILDVVVTGASSTDEAALTITPGAGQTLPAAYKNGITTKGGKARFYLPAGAWTVTAALGTAPNLQQDSKDVTLKAGQSGDAGSENPLGLTPAWASVVITAPAGASITFKGMDNPAQTVPSDDKPLTVAAGETSVTVSDLPVGSWKITATTGTGTTKKTDSATVTLNGGTNPGVSLTPN